jgi:antitoxin ParD1/3/4
MPSRAEKAVEVDLGAFAERVEQRVRDGEYDSVSEVVRAGLDALERQEESFDAILRAKVAEALADTRPPLSADEVVRDLEDRHARRLARDG